MDAKFMELTSRLDEGPKIEQELNQLRKEITERSSMSKMFERYHSSILEIQEAREMLEESGGDKEMAELLKDDLVRLLGDDENYGELHEL